MYFKTYYPKTDWINTPARTTHVAERRASKGANDVTPLDASACSEGYPYSQGLPMTPFLERYDNYPATERVWRHVMTPACE